ncbi:MAG: helix-turn-helix domain-containing protein [Verrucomicrobiae bacterium]|nr:helix-turn-helix domain-containing protein [Verrucomicrobiae bacterium]
MELAEGKSNTSDLKTSRSLSRKLSETQIFKDYEKAFSEASGLPLAIRPIQSFQMAMQGKTRQNPFCAIMAKTSKSCVACLEIQSELEQKAQLAPKSLSCFAGLCDTMIPIRVGERIIAFLQTGQVLLHEPSEEGFSRITQQLLKWGMDADLKRIEEAYFQSKVLTEDQYQGFVRMLSTFAEHLALIGNSIMVSETKVEPQTVSKARRFVENNFDRPISLDEAAKVVNTSVRYFCKVFKNYTGITFVDYLTRLRIEKSKNLLQNPNRRVSEVAFEVGFESLTQFNRSFKKHTGMTPTEYRVQPV